MSRKISEEQTHKQMIGPQLEMMGLVFIHTKHTFAEVPFRNCSPVLDMFGVDAVGRWFPEKEVDEVVEFANSLGA